MSIGRIRLTKTFLTCRFLCVSFFSWLCMSFVPYVFAQTDNVNAGSDKFISRGNNATNSKKPLVLKPEMVSEFIDHTKKVNQALDSSDQENIGREAMAMITEITKSNILYEKNKSSANLAFEEQKFNDREKQNKKMKEYNESYNKKYLASYMQLQKMRGQHAGYSGVHSDYSAYLQQFLASTSPDHFKSENLVS